ncbi:hypothetical protein WMY93_028472 [Mugilogobius chulae]|uniref:DDE Tnp4 domain-containing protein n=1 Tax=Mugilogobius chulae TaxID=88201 RepID=A0AAW0MV63_9GOBI
MDMVLTDHDYCSSSSESATLNQVLDETEVLRAEKAQLCAKIEEMAVRCRFGLKRYSSSDEDIRLYTRFASYASLMSFWSQIEPALSGLVRVTRAQTTALTEDAGPAASLQPIDEFFLFLTYLSLGLVLSDLANLFGIHQSTATDIISTWANFLYSVLGAVGIWPDEETVRKNMPEAFRDYPDTHVILNCTELLCQTPDSLQMYSNYKSHCTFKGLIGLAPHGPVTFVSLLYDTSISNRDITKHSGLVSHLKPSMAIMVDEGFLVEDVVPCKVHVLDSLRAKTQSTARLRVHIERVIRRVKEYKLFTTEIPLSLTGSVSQQFAVACLLVNYQNGTL